MKISLKIRRNELVYAAWIYIEINLHQISYCVCKINVFHSTSPIPFLLLSCALKMIIYFHIWRGYWKIFIFFHNFLQWGELKVDFKVFTSAHSTVFSSKSNIGMFSVIMLWASNLNFKYIENFPFSILTKKTVVAKERCYAEMVDCGHVIPFYQHQL